MKRFLLILGLLAIAFGTVSCEKEKHEKEQEDSDSIVLNTDKEWTTSDLSAYVGDISVLPQDLQTVISQRFPKKTGLENATVIFAGASDMTANADKIANALEGGAFLVTPAGVDLSPLGARPFLDPDSMIDLTPLLYCYSSWGDDLYYVMYDEPEITDLEDGTPSMSEEEWKELVRINEDMDDYIGTSMTDYDNDPAHNENYFQTRMDPFIDWLDAAYKGRSMLSAPESTYDELRANIEQAGQRLTFNYPFSLNVYIDKATGSKPDYLNKSGSISVEFYVYPLYMLSSNGTKAGDYYCIVSTITPHNESMWGPYAAAHGGCRNRIYGFWFSSMDVKTTLTFQDGTPIPGLEYFTRPLPENQNDSKSYSNGKTIGVNGSISGGTTAGNPYLVASVGISATWSSTTNYTLETINYSLNSSSNEVKYHYWSDGVDLKDDWDNWTKINRNFPASVRTEFNAHTMWVWHVPSSVVKDRDTRQFRLNTSIYLEYATWYHWRGAVRYDGNRKNHGITIPSKSWTLEAPDRTPWGFIRLKNATNNEMAHVSFYDDKGGLITTLTTSYSKGEEARIALVEGTYSVTWDIVNGDTGEVLSSWIYRNVKVHQGGNDDEATVRISTVDGEKTN